MRSGPLCGSGDGVQPVLTTAAAATLALNGSALGMQARAGRGDRTCVGVAGDELHHVRPRATRSRNDELTAKTAIRADAHACRNCCRSWVTARLTPASLMPPMLVPFALTRATSTYPSWSSTRSLE